MSWPSCSCQPCRSSTRKPETSEPDPIEVVSDDPVALKVQCAVEKDKSGEQQQPQVEETKNYSSGDAGYPSKHSTGTRNSAKSGAAARPRAERQPLKASDLKLSRRLTQDLGLDECDANEANEGLTAEVSVEKPPPEALRIFWLLYKVRAGLKRFRSRSTVVAEPTQKEVDRGIQIEGVYDFFTVADKKVRTRRMNEKVFHHRRMYDDPDGGQESEEDDMGMERTATTRSSASSGSSGGLDGGKVSSRDLAQKQRLHSEQEAIAHWGVLVGKAMHVRVIDFTAVADKYVFRRRYQDFTRRKGRIIASVRERAKAVVQQAWELAMVIVKEPMDKFDHEWQDESMLTHLFSRHYVDMLTLFCNTACKILAVQPTMVEAPAPCKIFGDIHGQFRDLLLFFRAFGGPDEHDAPNFVFNGDFVDRGEHQLEVIGLLLALKVLLPEKVWLVRGNHEDRYMSKRYGFQDECRRRLGADGPKLFELFHKTFSLLPLACVVGKRVLVVHGGIGDGQWTLPDCLSIKRPLGDDQLQDPDKAWIWNLMWSDPIEDDDDRREGVFGVHESPRGGISTQFGWNVTKMFCARNGLSLIVRSHQSKADSLGFDIMHENLLVRVFSARDYEGHGNDGAVLLIRPSEASNPDSMLTVRPQVIRSTTKAVQEEISRTGRLSGSFSSTAKVSKLLEKGPSGSKDRSSGKRSKRAAEEDMERSDGDDVDVAAASSGRKQRANKECADGQQSSPSTSSSSGSGSGSDKAIKSQEAAPVLPVVASGQPSQEQQEGLHASVDSAPAGDAGTPSGGGRLIQAVFRKKKR